MRTTMRRSPSGCTGQDPSCPLCRRHGNLSPPLPLSPATERGDVCPRSPWAGSMQRFVNSGIRPHEGADGHAPVDVIRIEAQAAQPRRRRGSRSRTGQAREREHASMMRRPSAGRYDDAPLICRPTAPAGPRDPSRMCIREHRGPDLPGPLGQLHGPCPDERRRMGYQHFDLMQLRDHLAGLVSLPPQEGGSVAEPP